MKATELLEIIKDDLAAIPEYIARTKEIQETKSNVSDTAASLVAEYDYAVYREIMDETCPAPDITIEPGRVEEFREALERYFDEYAPGENSLRRYIINISLYLVFIAKRPLHPPGIDFPDLKVIKGEDGQYYCGRKGRIFDGEPTLCRYCICRPL
ncbi:DUF2115 family protein [Methanolacinia paynteri]|uniref:DUF2115 family protein n=1 Tax=Methanolacinia paynteri TaxID=230356 RepID=UPI00064E28DD|nr:DUF2115 family protein [Methanolacinia paynteri]